MKVDRAFGMTWAGRVLPFFPSAWYRVIVFKWESGGWTAFVARFGACLHMSASDRACSLALCHWDLQQVSRWACLALVSRGRRGTPDACWLLRTCWTVDPRGSLTALCHVMPRHVPSSLLVSCHLTPCCDMSCHVLSRDRSPQVRLIFWSYFHGSRLVASSSVMACPVVFCGVPLFRSCYVLLSLLVSCHVLSCNDLAC